MSITAVQRKWLDDVAAGRASAYIQDGRVHVSTTATMEVPLTGTTVGGDYGGQRSGQCGAWLCDSREVHEVPPEQVSLASAQSAWSVETSPSPSTSRSSQRAPVTSASTAAPPSEPYTVT